MKRSLVFTTLFVIAGLCRGQKPDVYAGSQVPLKYDVGVGWQFGKRFSVNTAFGVLAKPYDKAILGILKAFDLEQGYIDMLSNAFKFGLVGDIGIRFHFKKNYVGCYGQYIHLFAQDAPADLIENYLGINLNNYRKLPRAGLAPANLDVALKSGLMQGGIVYGRRFPFKNKKFEMRLELAASKNLFSKSFFYLNGDENTALTDLIDAELAPIYKDYAYLASLNVYFAWRLFASEK